MFQATLDLRNRTEPSAIITLAPPLWKLVGPMNPPASQSELVLQNSQ